MIIELTSVISVLDGIQCYLRITYKGGKTVLMKGSAEDIQLVMAEARKNGEVDKLVESMINSDKLILNAGELINDFDVFTWTK